MLRQQTELSERTIRLLQHAILVRKTSYVHAKRFVESDGMQTQLKKTSPYSNGL